MKIFTIIAIIAFSCIAPNCSANPKEKTVIQETSTTQELPAIPASYETKYFVSPGGDDNSNSGTIDKPFRTVSKALTIIQPGQMICLRAGTYSFTSSITLAKTGSATTYFAIWGYQGESCVLDFTGESANSSGINITGSFWHIKGLEIIHAGKSGIRITGNYNIIEQCSTHHNGDAGLYIGISKGRTVNTDGTLAAYNRIINCDSWLNYDPYGSTGDGGNADGFACKLNAGKGNVFRGCRSWENSDDGWDLYLMNFPVVMENCWTWRNGDPASFSRPVSTAVWGGNGNGFKVGGGDPAKADEYLSHGAHILKNCIAFDMNYGDTASVRAFDRNNNMTGISLFNCLAFNSKVGFSFSKQPDDGTHHVLKNCVVYNCPTGVSLSTDTLHDHNSWDSAGASSSASDFKSLMVSLAKAPRNSDGSLPSNDFAKLAQGSVLVDKGITYSGILNAVIGTAPDLGPFECY